MRRVAIVIVVINATRLISFKVLTTILVIFENMCIHIITVQYEGNICW